MSKSHDVGRLGEEVTAKYLEKYGFIIIKRNFRIRGGEIDIIARHGSLIVFVEVKSRNIDYGNEYGTALEAVNNRKIEHIIKTAKFWIYRQPTGTDYDYRFDVSEVQFSHNKLIKLNYIKSAFTL
jgi:putative endonuclease